MLLATKSGLGKVSVLGAGRSSSGSNPNSKIIHNPLIIILGVVLATFA
jgi:hypothetical protein